MTDSEIRKKVWDLFSRYRGIDSLIINHLFSLQGAKAGEEVTIQEVFSEFVAIDNMLNEVRDLVRPDLLRRHPVTAKFKIDD